MDIFNKKEVYTLKPGPKKIEFVPEEETKTSYGEKDVKDLAFEVIAGKWGDIEEAKKKLESEGHDSDKVMETRMAILTGDYFG